MTRRQVVFVAKLKGAQFVCSLCHKVFISEKHLSQHNASRHIANAKALADNAIEPSERIRNLVDYLDQLKPEKSGRFLEDQSNLGKSSVGEYSHPWCISRCPNSAVPHRKSPPFTTSLASTLHIVELSAQPLNDGTSVNAALNSHSKNHSNEQECDASNSNWNACVVDFSYDKREGDYNTLEGDDENHIDQAILDFGHYAQDNFSDFHSAFEHHKFGSAPSEYDGFLSAPNLDQGVRQLSMPDQSFSSQTSSPSIPTIEEHRPKEATSGEFINDQEHLENFPLDRITMEVESRLMNLGIDPHAKRLDQKLMDSARLSLHLARSRIIKNNDGYKRLYDRIKAKVDAHAAQLPHKKHARLSAENLKN